jgi:DNA-binding transcriptional MerR regulator
MEYLPIIALLFIVGAALLLFFLKGVSFDSKHPTDLMRDSLRAGSYANPLQTWWEGKLLAVGMKNREQVRAAINDYIQSLATDATLTAMLLERSMVKERWMRQEDIAYMAHRLSIVTAHKLVLDERRSIEMIKQAQVLGMAINDVKEFNKKLNFDESDIYKKQEMDKAELKHETDKAYEEIRANFIYKYFPDHQQIYELQERLDELYREKEEIEQVQPYGWQNQLADRQKTIKALRRNQDGLRKRLLETYKQEVVVKARKKSVIR